MQIDAPEPLARREALRGGPLELRVAVVFEKLGEGRAAIPIPIGIGVTVTRVTPREGIDWRYGRV